MSDSKVVKSTAWGYRVALGERKKRMNEEILERIESKLDRLIELLEKKNTKVMAKKARPDSVQEITDYAKSIGFKLDGQYFIDYQESRGWRLKNGLEIKDWKAVVRTWKATQEKYTENDNNKEEKRNPQVEKILRDMGWKGE